MLRRCAWDLAGLPREGNPEGMNLEMGDQSRSNLTQRYASPDGDRSAELAIVFGKSGTQMLSPQEDMLVLKEFEPITDEAALLKAAAELPLATFISEAK